MQSNRETVFITTGVSVQWNAINTLKVLNNKVLIDLNDGVVLEIAGLTPKAIDALFIAYSRHLRTPSPIVR